MDHLGNLTGERNALLIFTFLQAGHEVTTYRQELLSLAKDLNFTQDINCNGRRVHSLHCGDLETDGHHSINIRSAIDDIQPIVQLQVQGGHNDAAVVHAVAQMLGEIAAEFEERVVAQATRNLNNKLTNSSSNQWLSHLASEVDWVIKQGVGLENLPQERVIFALALTLVRGVCIKTPRLMRSLFRTALDYIGQQRRSVF